MQQSTGGQSGRWDDSIAYYVLEIVQHDTGGDATERLKGMDVPLNLDIMLAPAPIHRISLFVVK